MTPAAIIALALLALAIGYAVARAVRRWWLRPITARLDEIGRRLVAVGNREIVLLEHLLRQSEYQSASAHAMSERQP